MVCKNRRVMFVLYGLMMDPEAVTTYLKILMGRG